MRLKAHTSADMFYKWVISLSWSRVAKLMSLADSIDCLMLMLWDTSILSRTWPSDLSTSIVFINSSSCFPRSFSKVCELNRSLLALIIFSSDSWRSKFKLYSSSSFVFDELSSSSTILFISDLQSDIVFSWSVIVESLSLTWILTNNNSFSLWLICSLYELYSSSDFIMYSSFKLCNFLTVSYYRFW